MKPSPPPDLGRWRQIEPILDQALELPGPERSSLLAVACAGDPSLRSDVEALLAADAAAGGFLGLPAGEYAPDLLAEAVGEEESEEDLAGLQVGPYRLRREIGSGGMGTVYEAEDVRLGRRVAVKLLPPELSRNREAKERFLREARAASAVEHPNLCTVHDIGESAGRLYIVLSLYEGETLRERLRRGALPPAEARDVAIQVARGLARAHEAGIIHRDLKPANVMLTRSGEAKILDFGIARLAGDEVSLTRTGAALGTPAYMSPEQVRGEPVDPRTDVWSLGVLLYEMVAGRRPFGGEGVQAVAAAILTQEPEPLERVHPGVPPELARVASRALAKDPAERYANAAELLADLESGSVSDRGRPRMVLRKSLLAGVLATVALVGLALFWRPWIPRTPLRVALLRPKVALTQDNPELASVAYDVTEATLGALTSLEGIQPLDPPEQGEEGSSEAERRRSAEADEVLRPELDCQRSPCRLSFHRLGKPGDAVLRNVGPFEIETGIENAYQLAEEIQVKLQQLYLDHPPRPGSPGRVRPQDYSTYIKLERRYRSELLGADELAQLDALLRTSPDLLGACLLAASIARLQEDLDRALGYAERARKLAPYDPRPLFYRLRIEVQGNRFDAAQATLLQLTHLAPNDVRVESANADLLEAQGELEEARRLRQKLVQRRPTWNHVLELATVESRLGESDSARRRLGDLLAAQPDNQYVRQHLAALEAGSGDLKRAEALYEDLIRARPTSSDLTNLGLVRFVLGNYAGAIEAYRRALKLDPNDLMTRFNLAATLEARGDLAEARSLFRTLAKEFAAAPPLDPTIRMLHAQCLARLGQRSDAARLANDVLKKRPEDIGILHQAAQLYALLGERYSALFYTELALKNGLRPEWFKIPEFRSFKEDPGFRALLEERIPAKTVR